MDVKIGQFLIGPIVAGIVALLQTKFNVEEKWLWLVTAVLMVGGYAAANLLPETAMPQAELVLGAITVFLLSAGLLKARVDVTQAKMTYMAEDALWREKKQNIFGYRDYGVAAGLAVVLVGATIFAPFLWPITAIGVGAGWWAIIKNS